MIQGRTSGGQARDIKVDNEKNALVTVDFFHHMIHEGKCFTATDVDSDVDTLAPKYYRFTAPAALEAHFGFTLYADAAGLVELFEAPTEDAVPVPGTALVAYNRKRSSANAATATIKHDPTFADDGTKIWQARVGASVNPAQSEGGAGGSRHEFDVTGGETYVIKFTPDADNTVIWLEFDWYEI